MDLSCCTGSQISEVVTGYGAASRGEPYDPHQTKFWQEGYRLWLALEPKQNLPTKH